MLIETIEFGMHNTDEAFLVPNTEENYALIAGNRFTRQIKFTKTFSFQAEKEMKAPMFMLETLVDEYLSEIIAEEMNETGFGIDEMHGEF